MVNFLFDVFFEVILYVPGFFRGTGWCVLKTMTLGRFPQLSFRSVCSTEQPLLRRVLFSLVGCLFWVAVLAVSIFVDTKKEASPAAVVTSKEISTNNNTPNESQATKMMGVLNSPKTNMLPEVTTSIAADKTTKPKASEESSLDDTHWLLTHLFSGVMGIACAIALLLIGLICFFTEETTSKKITGICMILLGCFIGGYKYLYLFFSYLGVADYFDGLSLLITLVATITGALSMRSSINETNEGNAAAAPAELRPVEDLQLARELRPENTVAIHPSQNETAAHSGKRKVIID